MTSCSRPPLLGFTQLDPPFSIRRVDTSDEVGYSLKNSIIIILLLLLLLIKEESINIPRTLRSLFNVASGSGSQDRLPTSSTCFNLLKLPHYSSKRILREKLLFSVTSNAGFELS